MKKTILTITLALTIGAASAQQRAPQYPGYTLAWQDEFNGAALDEDAWTIEVNGNGGGNNELQYYCRENVTIENEPSTGVRCLTLTARRENYKGKSFTSGRLNTLNKVFFTRGRIESRIMIPKTKNGLWPAFWMMGNDFSQVGWPRCGEIDIFEMGNSAGISSNHQTTYINGACHWGFYKNGAYPNYAKHSNYPYSLQDGRFHLFTCIWDEERLRFYVDLDQYPAAQPYFEMEISDTSGEWSTGNYFQKDCFIIYDLAVGGNFTGITNPAKITALPNAGSELKMYIDWVRVYQNDDCLPVQYPDSFEFGHEDEGSIPGTGIIDDEDHSGTPTIDPVKDDITSAATPTHVASDVLSIYSDAYTTATPDLQFNDWTSAANRGSIGTPIINADGDNMFRIEKFAWYGMEYGKTIDTSAYDFLHADFYATASGNIEVTPITGDTERPQKISVNANEWTSADFAIATYAQQGMSLKKNYQIKLAGTCGTLYLDNVYFWKSGSDGIANINEASTIEYYDLQGRRHDSIPSGVAIRRNIQLDGTSHIEKVLSH